jgi:lipopolysaccharide biosynthesis glycosyltransferase
MFSFYKIFLRLGLFVAMACVLPAEEIHVAFCLDNNYAEYTGVAAYSLCKNKALEDEVIIHIVMTEPLKSEHREKFQQLESLFPKIQIQIHDDERTIQCIAEAIDMPNGWLRIGIDHYPVKGMAARLVLDKILPETLHKVIYLDGDILVLDSLKNLWQKLPKENYAIAGIADSCRDPVIFPSQGIMDRICELHIYCPDISFPLYINSGVLVLDLDILRQENLFSDVIAWMVRYRSLRPDQDAINVVLHDRTLECEGKWDVFPDLNSRNTTTKKPVPGAAIMHYAGPKPWAPPHRIVDHRWWQPKHWPTLWKYITLQPPTLWHQYRQESPWRHSKAALFTELFGTSKDRKIFIPFLGMILGVVALPFLGISFYVRKRRHSRASSR